MATRDRSQGIAFSYSEKPIVIRKSEDVVTAKPMDELNKQIKDNLDRLQKLRHKLDEIVVAAKRRKS